MSRCWHIFENHFSTNKSEIHQEIESENLCQQKYEERLKEEDFGDSKYGLLRKYLWNLTEYPETSLAAQVIGKQKWKDFFRKKSEWALLSRCTPSYPWRWWSCPPWPSYWAPCHSSHLTWTSSSLRKMGQKLKMLWSAGKRWGDPFSSLSL